MSKQQSTKLAGMVCAALLAVVFEGAPAAQEASLPPAPIARLLAEVAPMGRTPTPAGQSSSIQAADAGPKLTVAEAEQMAIRNNPNISVARLLALAQAQVTREVQSAELPTVQGDLTAAGAHANSRITAGRMRGRSLRASGQRSWTSC